MRYRHKDGWTDRLLKGDQSEGFKDGIWALRLRFGPQNWDLGLKAAIWFSVWDLVLEGGIWSSRMGIRPQGWDLGFEAKICVRGGGLRICMKA